MRRSRVVGISTVAFVVFTAGACGGSSSPSARGPAPSPPKLALAAGGASTTPSAAGSGAALFPERLTTYVLDGTLPDLGPTAPVRRLQAHTVGASDAQRFADALGLTGTPTRTASGWVVPGDTATLTIDTTDGVANVSYFQGVPGSIGGSSGGSTGSGSAPPGGEVVNGPNKVAVPPSPPGSDPTTTGPGDNPPGTVPTVTVPPAPVDVPSATDAEPIARALLDRLGVLTGQTWSTTVADSGGVAVSCPAGVPCPMIPPVVSARTVTFSPKIDGVPVDGIDWSVTIGEHRRIESLNGEWAAPVAIGEYSLRSTAAVFADLQHGTARYAGPTPMMATASGAAEAAPPVATTPAGPTTPAAPPVVVHVAGAALGITRWNATDNGRAVVDLVPTYRFHARVDDGAAYDIVVLALDPAAATFTNPMPTPRPLPAEPAPLQPVAPDTGASTPPSP